MGPESSAGIGLKGLSHVTELGKKGDYKSWLKNTTSLVSWDLTIKLNAKEVSKLSKTNGAGERFYPGGTTSRTSLFRVPQQPANKKPTIWQNATRADEKSVDESLCRQGNATCGINLMTGSDSIKRVPQTL